jgi:UDP-N-acetylmuramyl pentapeptide phosphotransferase/UDP-N-acetylglucosamine-1-phosphate transferase
VNAFNLIDGVDGLAAGIGFISCLAFGTWFIFAREFPYAALSFALAGALAGFLIFNFSPARIFMGDSGSLVIGMFICVLAIKMIEYPIQKLDSFWMYVSKPVFAISAIAYPLLDTLRAFTIRAVRGQSPFVADRNHVHHKLLDCRYSHKKTVLIIYTFSVITIGASLLTYYFRIPTYSLITVVATGGIFLAIVMSLNRKKTRAGAPAA